MRKFIPIIFILSLLILTGCKKDKEPTLENKLNIEINTELTKTQYLDPRDLEEKINNKETFIIYLANETCSMCQLFQPVIDSVVNETKLTIYKSYVSRINTYKSSITKDFFKLEYTPSIAIVIEGELFHIINGNNHEIYFDTVESILSFLEKYINIPAKNQE